ncbi:MAG TPA: ABC transporter ATP-binding protein [Syntrophomonadaceae bacterium]|nr:ABC transporter ATP-binding protein [Syntrophomonadaceae bacterium]
MIELAGISKSFGKIHALQAVSLSVDEGSIYGLVGSNGAGKTTLLKILAGIYRHDAGQVTIDGQVVYENERTKDRTLFIPDNLYFFPNYTIRDMADFYSGIYSSWNHERFLKLQQVFDIEVGRRVVTLSKGMQRQVAFWLGLALAPDIMILDEPLDGLDAVMRHKVKNLIFQDVAAREMTVIISSHNLRELEGFCDHIGILHQGQMLLQKDLDELKTGLHKIQMAFGDGIPEALLKEINALHLEKRGSVLMLVVRGACEETVRRLEKFNPAILDILPLTLEEIFIYEMGGVGYEIKNLVS